MLATWDIRSSPCALMISSTHVFSSLSTERARVSTLLFPPYFRTDIPSSQHKVFERTLYSLCSLDYTTHFLLAPWNTHRSCQKQSGAHRGKCAPTTTTHHAQAAGETASMHQDGSHPPRAFSKGCSGLETSALPRSTRNPAALPEWFQRASAAGMYCVYIATGNGNKFP